MGCSYDTCMVTKLPILPSEKVVVFFTVNSNYGELPIIFNHYANDNEYLSITNESSISDDILNEYINTCIDYKLDNYDIKSIIETINEYGIYFCNKEYIRDYDDNMDNIFSINYVKIKKTVFDSIIANNSLYDKYNIDIKSYDQVKEMLMDGKLPAIIMNETYKPDTTLELLKNCNDKKTLNKYAAIIYEMQVLLWFLSLNRMKFSSQQITGQNINLATYNLFNNIHRNEINKLESVIGN